MTPLAAIRRKTLAVHGLCRRGGKRALGAVAHPRFGLRRSRVPASRAAQALDSLRDLDLSTQPLHGDPHLDGNCLFTQEGPVFIDFEASCTGPKEWDLTFLPKEVAFPLRLRRL
ncbi:MAG: aminoglycoside phosphotransferase family protein [Actinobacteria bacterium]|nr:aminoglycoside phosphotransferase family protein [Actinomycetota bacterium]